MKHRIKSLIALLLVLCFSVCPVFASESASETTTEVIPMGNGMHLEVVTTVYDTNTRTQVRYTTKTYTYIQTATDTRLVAYMLKGWFNYDGVTSEATASESECFIYQRGWDLDNCFDYCSGRSVYGAAKFDGPNNETVSIPGSITCDKDGNTT